MFDIHNPEILLSVLESLQIGVSLVDNKRKILFWNEGAERISGFLRHEVIGRSCHDNILDHCDELGRNVCTQTCPLTSAVKSGQRHEFELYLRHKKGNRIKVHVWTVPIRDGNGKIVGVAECFDECSAMEILETPSSSLAIHGCLDTASGVPNRAFTQSRLRKALETFNEHHIPFGVLLARVQDFEHQQELHGRQGAEAIFGEVAQRMKHILRSPSNFLGRWSNDQLLAVMHDCNVAELATARDAIEQSASAAEVFWWGDSLRTSVSVGRAFVLAGDSVEAIVQRAEASLRSAGTSSLKVLG